ncbi:MAG: cell division protein FtsA [Candidatus Omnitrophota bacterium]|nr:MAG: cell division protein FtsA [Candidatus Omnitrophota bacterium]
MNEEIITALDLGSSKIFGITGIRRETGIEIIGEETIYPTEEVIKKGRIIDMEGVTNYVYEVFGSLKSQTGERIERVILGIGGGFIKGRVYSKEIDIEPKGRAIENTDLQNLKREIKKIALSQVDSDQEILHILPQQYKIDGANTTQKDPVGLHGNKIEGKLHVLLSEKNPLKDIINCIKNAGAEVEAVYPHSWAVSESVLTEEEKKLGCLVIDFGKGTTDIALYIDNKLVISDSYRVGGGNIDLDLSIELHTSLNFAEELKKNYGWCNYKNLIKGRQPFLNQKVEIITLSGKIKQQTTVEKISKVVYERVKEIFQDIILKDVKQEPLFSTIGAGIIISGGSSKLKGLLQLSNEIFNQPTRLGIPKKMLGIEEYFRKPEFACGIGLLLLTPKREKKLPWWLKIKEKIENWFY